MKPFDLTFRHRESGAFLTIEDDGRVAYAYFHAPSGEILGDVWLYNRGPAPSTPEWENRDKAPFANPAAFARENPGFALPRKATEIAVRWSAVESEALMAEVRIRGLLIAMLRAGAKPGWSIAARKDGPLAKVLQELMPPAPSAGSA